MAQSKKTNKLNSKNGKKVMKKVKKIAKANKFFTFICVILLLGIITFAGYKYYTVVIKTNQEIEKITAILNEEIPDEVTDSISLNTVYSQYPNIKISWKSSDFSTINPLQAQITQPAYTKGDKTVTLTATFNFNSDNSLSNKIYDLLVKNNKTITFKIKVLAKEATDLEKVTNVGASLYVPDATFFSIGLPTSSSLFDNVSIAWGSSSGYILMDGTVTTPSVDTLCTLTAIVTSNTITKTYEFPITILASDYYLEEVNETFNDNPNNFRYTTISDSNITYTQATVKTYPDYVPSDDLAETGENSENFLRLRYSLATPASISTELINNPLKFSFKYLYPNISDNHTSELSTFTIKIYNSLEDTIGTELSPITITHTNDESYQTIDIDLSSYSQAKVEIKVNYGWEGQDYDFVDIEDVIITKDLEDEDFIDWLVNNLNTTISNSISLPLTTCYGGVISWQSSDVNKINNSGKLLVSNFTNETVTMNATITYGSRIIATTLDIKLIKTTNLTPVEMYFIDLGKYGASDCGESIYIKYGEIDILVDAGDAFDTSKQAIEETLNSHMNDTILEYVIATHPDADHIGGMPNIFEKYEVTNLYTFNGTHTSQKYQKYVTAYTNEGSNVYNIYDVVHATTAEKYLYLDDDVFLEFIDTTYYGTEVTETNGRSIVFVLNAHGKRILMTGDADNGAGHTDLEEKYMNNVGDIDILKAVHHATAAGTTTAFLRAVDPEIVIVCNGNYLGNKHGHPHSDAINNIYQYDNKITVYAICGGGANGGTLSSSRSYTTSSNGDERFIDRNGTITITIDGNGYNISSEYYHETPLEFSTTTFWTNHPLKEYTYQN